MRARATHFWSSEDAFHMPSSMVSGAADFSPLMMGMYDASMMCAVAMMNAQWESVNCDSAVWPEFISAAAPATKPSMARRPFTTSGPHDLKPNPL